MSDPRTERLARALQVYKEKVMDMETALEMRVAFPEDVIGGDFHCHAGDQNRGTETYDFWICLSCNEQRTDVYVGDVGFHPKPMTFQIELIYDSATLQWSGRALFLTDDDLFGWRELIKDIIPITTDPESPATPLKPQQADDLARHMFAHQRQLMDEGRY